MKNAKHAVHRLGKNVAWLLAGRIFRILVGVAVLGAIGRHLGPIPFGQLNFSIALASLFAAVASLGFEGIVIRDLIREPARSGAILGSAFVMRVFGAMGATLLSVGVAATRGDPVVLQLSFLIALAFFPGAGDVLELWMQKNVEGKTIFRVRSLAAILTGGLRLGLVAMDAPLAAYAWAFSVEALLGVAGFIFFYHKGGESLRAWRVDGDLIRRILCDSWPLIASGVLIALYGRIEQLMVEGLLGDYVLGIYYAAVRISEMWVFLPAALLTTVYPILVGTRENRTREVFEARMQALFDVITGLGYAVAIGATIAAPFLVPLVFGEIYRPAVNVLIIQAWTAPFLFSGAARVQFFLIENLNIYHTFAALIGIAVNASVAWYLMAFLGAPGAAFGSLAGAAVSAFGTSLLFPKLRSCAKFQIKAFLAPLRLVAAIKNFRSCL